MFFLLFGGGGGMYNFARPLNGQNVKQKLRNLVFAISVGSSTRHSHNHMRFRGFRRGNLQKLPIGFIV